MKIQLNIVEMSVVRKMYQKCTTGLYWNWSVKTEPYYEKILDAVTNFAQNILSFGGTPAATENLNLEIFRNLLELLSPMIFK